MSGQASCKITCDWGQVFAYMDLFIGSGVIVQVFNRNMFNGGFSGVVQGICFLCLGIALILLALAVPVQVRKEMPFMFRHIGKGCFYIFLGSVLGTSTGDFNFNKIFFFVCFIVGLCWIVFNFIPGIPVAQPLFVNGVVLGGMTIGGGAQGTTTTTTTKTTTTTSSYA